MTRYEHTNYKRKFACFTCRKCFKYESLSDRDDKTRRSTRCPQCGDPIYDMGLDFKAPRRRDIEQWKKVEVLYHNGVDFSPSDTIGSEGPGYRPARLNQVGDFLEARRRAALEKDKNQPGFCVSKIES